MKSEFENALKWYSINKSFQKKERVCETRDVFQARLDRMYLEVFKKTGEESMTALLVAISGEIGNNCFDHNLGQWQDLPGCYFQYGFEDSKVWTVITDRGQGIFSSLKGVVSSLKDDQQALDMAFEKKISGRSPERRGNGLKFVRSVINGEKRRGLLFLSGNAILILGDFESELKTLFKQSPRENQGQGTFAFILWNFIHEN